MTKHILHLGFDTCHRRAVLESAGFTVGVCASAALLFDTLEEQSPDLVVIAETESAAFRELVPVVRTSVPVVLFRESSRAPLDKDVDLVIPILHPPAAWLAEIQALIEKSHRVRRPARARGVGVRRLAAQAVRPSESKAEKESRS
jgi:hypothetical protein